MRYRTICLLLTLASSLFFTYCSKNIQQQMQVAATTQVREDVKFLTLSKTDNFGMPKTVLYPDSVYTSYSLIDPLFTPMPQGFEDQVISFRLPKGYMAVFAENSDGTGESVCYVALDSGINAILPQRLQNNVSFVRYKAISNMDKKGTASIRDSTVQALGGQWFYGWSLNRASLPNQQFVAMTWGKGNCTDINVAYLVRRSDVDHLLSFNEPDNVSQSNIQVIDTAIERYKIMQKTGLRLGAPVTTQDQVSGVGQWLPRFMEQALLKKIRIDYLPVHWYDWGNQTNNKATDSLTADAVFKRFVAYIGKVHATYPALPIWVTEFNANVNRTSPEVHKFFMKMAVDWMNNTPYIERYAYFFPKPVPEVNADFSLTDAGAYWKSLSSAKAFSGNIVTADTIVK